MKEEIVTIEKIIAGGTGLGLLADGLVVFIPFTIPGEKARIGITKRHKDYAEGRLKKLIVSSPDRVEPPCRLYGLCGGCDLQHVNIDKQLAIKESILKEFLVRARVADPPTADKLVISPAVASPRAMGYRLRIRLQVDQKTQKFGYFRPRSRLVEPLDVCPLARPEINTILGKLRGSESFWTILRQTGSFELILNPDSGRLVILVRSKRKPRALEKKSAEALLAEVETLQNVLFTVPGHSPITMGDKEKKHNLISLTLPAHGLLTEELTLTMEPGAFFQVNEEQNRNLIGILLEWSSPAPGKKILDLFCGMGNFSLPLAKLGAEMLGMDLQRAAIRSAKRNAELAGLPNCRFEKSAALDGIRELVRLNKRFDTIILDPPRQGCRDVVPYLPATDAGTIIYVSCDPATLSRDLKTLGERGYQIDGMRIVDMFPQTHHMEVMTKLVRA